LYKLKELNMKKVLDETQLCSHLTWYPSGKRRWVWKANVPAGSG